MHPAPPDLARAGEMVNGISLTVPTDEGDTHVQWATAIAKRIARWRGLRDHEEAEVVAHALFTLVRKREKFAARPVYGEGETADGHFRGWIHMSLRAECLRECKRLRGGGTFHTPKKSSEVIVEGLPSRRTEGGIEEVELADHREPSPDYEEAVKSFRKRRWDTRTGEEIAEPSAPELTYPAGTSPAVSGTILQALVEVDILARAGETEGGGL